MAVQSIKTAAGRRQIPFSESRQAGSSEIVEGAGEPAACEISGKGGRMLAREIDYAPE